MSLSTFSVFYYGFEFDTDTQYIDFDEGSGALQAEVELGSFTPTEMALNIQEAMNSVGVLTYTVTFNRADRSFTIDSTANFDLLVSSGVSANKAYPAFGFTGSDRTSASTYTGGFSGNEYLPQFVLQDHISTENLQKLVMPSINKSASGVVEVIRFGVEKFMQCNIKFATNLHIGGNHFKNNPSGVEDLQAFMQYITQKKPVEFMEDELTRSTYQKMLLESTVEERDGTGYLLKELYDKGLPDIYETGLLRFRLVGE